MLMEWLTQSSWLILFSIALVSFLESFALIGILVPGIVLLFSLAALAHSADISMVLVLIYGGLGAAAGDLLSYAIGYHLKQHLLNSPWFIKRKSWIEQGTWFIDKWGWLSVIIGRFLGPLRPIVPVLSGTLGMAPSRFVPLSLVTVIMWAPVYLLPGYYTGELADLWQLQPVADRSLMTYALTMMSIAGATLIIYHHTHPEQLLLKGWLTRDQADRWPIHSGNLALLSSLIFTTIYFLAPLERDLSFHQWSSEWQTYRISEFWDFLAAMNHESLIAILLATLTFWLLLNRRVHLAVISTLAFTALWLTSTTIENHAPLSKEFDHLSLASILVFIIAFTANIYSNSLHGLKRWPAYLAAFGFMLMLIISLMWTDKVSVSAGIASLSLGLFYAAMVRILWQALHLTLYLARPGGITFLLFIVTLAFAIINGSS